MPSKKKNNTIRVAQAAAQAMASDYDTDTAAYASASQYAVPRKRTNNELNLTVLQRYNPDIARIHSIAPFAVVYLFSPEAQQWEKCGIEGTLFVCEIEDGSGRPRWQVVILNRKSLDNFVTELKSSEDVELTEQYIILQVMGADQIPMIYGLWIFSDGDTVPSSRDLIGSAIVECAAKAEWYAANFLDQGQGYDGQEDYQDQPFEDEGEQTEGEYGAVSGMESYSAQPVQQPPSHNQPTSQPMDLLSLFKGQQIQQQQHQQQPQQQQQYQAYNFQHAPSPSQYQSQSLQHAPGFPSNTDTDFFRGGASPALQQNALLNLFKK